MQLKQIIPDYNSTDLPISRSAVAGFLSRIDQNKTSLSSTDLNLLNDYLAEFEYDMNGTVDNSVSFLDGLQFNNLFDNDKQKYLYRWSDENLTLSLDGMLNYSYRKYKDEVYGNTSLHLAELGLRFRGTFFKSLGFYLRLSNGRQVNGSYDARIVAQKYDPKLKSNIKFLGEKYYDSYEGYLRYENEKKWLAITLGREALSMGTGFIDKLYLSQNAAPFDFARLDLKYKNIQYSFYYGNVRGDSLGVKVLSSKNVIGHRLGLVFDNAKISVFETIVAAETPFTFTFFNPVSFLTSGDFSTQTNQHNSLIGFDLEITPTRNLAFQGSLLVDDYNFKTISNHDSTSNDNKFGWQLGAEWTDAFTLPNLTMALEYTRLNPFVYSHRTNESSYTNWDLSLGHALSPNSDEIALKLSYDITYRIHLDLLYQKQRSGVGYIIDSNGEMIYNSGGDINRGDGDFLVYHPFLDGNRINRNIYTVDLRVEPIKQYFLMLHYSLQKIDKLYNNTSPDQSVLYVTVGVDF